ncbi:MAG TPA: hypothetical protein VFS43_35745 [Polyangiaceae bacterium]|nr:hypothetical protein [Polyangiaceae bacterium]
MFIVTYDLTAGDDCEKADEVLAGLGFSFLTPANRVVLPNTTVFGRGPARPMTTEGLRDLVWGRFEAARLRPTCVFVGRFDVEEGDGWAVTRLRRVSEGYSEAGPSGAPLWSTALGVGAGSPRSARKPRKAPRKRALSETRWARCVRPP